MCEVVLVAFSSYAIQSQGIIEEAVVRYHQLVIEIFIIEVEFSFCFHPVDRLLEVFIQLVFIYPSRR
jgi:hypothetical protein